MEAQNILNGNISDLKELHSIIERQNSINDQITNISLEKQKIEKEAMAEENMMSENIEFTIKKRRDQIVADFDAQIGKAQDKLKHVRSERGREKDKKMALRIKEETKDLVLENKNIKEEYRTGMKQKGLSRFWDNKWFLSVFFPRTALEFLILMATMVIGIIGIPTILCTLMGSTFWLVKTLVVLIYVALFVVVYAFIYRFARDDYKDAFIAVRQKQAEIGKNISQINKIKKNIKHDKNEERYELHKYDEEIKDLEDNISDIVSRKNAALDDFEKTTREDIRNEICKRDMVSINEKRNNVAKLSEEQKELEVQSKEMALTVSTNYTAYMGEENLSLEKLEKLIVIMEGGSANTIGEAINVASAM